MEDAARTAGLVRAPALAVARLEAGAAAALAGIVAASFVVRTAAGWLRATPAYFPDEYLYAELGRSLGESGRALVRGAEVGFPALLQPLLTAPAWLVEDVEVAYRLVQAIGALAVSLAAVPVYLLARRLGLGTWPALASAAVAVAVPDAVFASFVLSEPIAYPLVLAAVAAGTSALARPGRRAQLAFVAFAALAAFARVQFVVLPLCFLGALLAVGLRERRLRSALREQGLALSLFALTSAALAVTPLSGLGIYGGVLDFDVHPLSLGLWTGAGGLILLYAAGWILVPGAALGLALALGRPRSRAELGFAALAALLGSAVLVQSGFFAANTSERIQERYVFYAAPLLAVCFGLYASRGWPHRLAHAALAGALIVLSLRVPLAGFTAADGKADSPTLWAAAWVEEALGGAANGSLAIAAAAVLLSLAAVAAALRPRLGTSLALGLAVATCGAASAGAAFFDVGNASAVRTVFLPAERAWVDRAALGDVALLRSRGGPSADALQQLFWNRSLERVLLLPGSGPFDGFRTDRVGIAADGSLAVRGQPVEGPLLVDGYAATVRLRGASVVAASPNYTLWRPRGRPRLALYALGRFNDGWLSRAGAVSIWPQGKDGRVMGRLMLTLSLPAEASSAITVRFHLPDGGRHEVRVGPGTTRVLALPACSKGMWRASFTSDLHHLVGTRFVSVRASEPFLRPDADACRQSLRPA